MADAPESKPAEPAAAPAKAPVATFVSGGPVAKRKNIRKRKQDSSDESVRAISLVFLTVSQTIMVWLSLRRMATKNLQL